MLVVMLKIGDELAELLVFLFLFGPFIFKVLDIKILIG
jgi:hypothetical protein